MILYDDEADAALDRQLPEDRWLLLAASILDRLCASLCDAVCERTDSADRLARLADSEAFLSRDGDWYDLRREYADVWRNRLFHTCHDQLPELHLRASEWYERIGFVDEAIRHAMAAGDYSRATRIIGEAAPTCIQRGEMSTLLGWLGALPDPVVKSSASLCIFHAWALFLTGNFRAADNRLLDAEAAPQQESV